TDASFVLTLSGFPPGFPFGLAFPTLSDSFVSDSRPKRVPLSSSSLSRFPFQRFQPYQTLFRSVSGPNLIPAAVGVAFAFRRIRLYQKRFGRANRLRGPDKGIDGSSGIQFQ
ncbi:hypothetical protein ABZV67_08845, partial [Streptomyces sp. NPDC005065]|uniref:hypothetical protein n=2 Tax=unclassified Streptomyces TaxID=2593676 RepID=UPI0033ABD153